MADQPTTSTTSTSTAAPAAATPTPAAPAPAQAAGGASPQTQDVKPAAPASPDAPKAEPGAVAEFALKLPEGVEANHPAVQAIKATAKELGLTEAQAQGLLERNYAASKAARKADEESWSQQLATWKSETEADPEIGGKNLESSRADVQRFMARFGGKEFETLLNKTGLGVHKDMFRVLAKVGRAMREDSIAGSSSGVSTKNDREAFLRDMFPKSPELFAKP